MKKRLAWIGLGAAAAALLLAAQQSDVIIKLTKGDKVAIAVPDLRGAGDAQQFMDVFNQTLWSDLESWWPSGPSISGRRSMPRAAAGRSRRVPG
jgi:hypothetical protein